MENNNSNIESYDGTDAYYEGTDKDYEDFLKQVDGNTNAAKNAAGVESSDGAPLGETINIRGVIDMVRKKAGEISEAAKKSAKKFGGEVKEQITDYIAAAGEHTDEKKDSADDAGEKPEKKESAVSEITERLAGKIGDKPAEEASDIPAAVSNTAKAAKEHLKTASGAAREKLEELTSIGADTRKISADTETIIGKIDAAASKINDIEVKQIENKNNYDRGVNDLLVSINGITGDIAEMKQNSGNITKLSDAVFDLKNTQQNSKRSIEALEAQLISLRKKCVAGITVISILSAIIIALQIISILS